MAQDLKDALDTRGTTNIATAVYGWVKVWEPQADRYGPEVVGAMSAYIAQLERALARKG